MDPFLKWPGGKRWLVASYGDLIPASYKTYYEPFLGSGAMFFYLKPDRAVLSDINEDLINTYRAIGCDSGGVVSLLRGHQKRHSDEHYYRMRRSKPRLLSRKAARFIYLNRTCFNGIYRVNRRGEFNVPKGDRENVILETDDFKLTESLLKAADLQVEDFEVIVDKSGEDDFLFADPPYTVTHNYNGFKKYNESLFQWEDQLRLADSLSRAKRRGVKVLSTNAHHRLIIELYVEMGFEVISVNRYCSVSAKAHSRTSFEEVLIKANY